MAMGNSNTAALTRKIKDAVTAKSPRERAVADLHAARARLDKIVRKQLSVEKWEDGARRGQIDSALLAEKAAAQAEVVRAERASASAILPHARQFN